MPYVIGNSFYYAPHTGCQRAAYDLPRRIRTKYEGICIYCRAVVPVGETVFWEQGKGIWHQNCGSPKSSDREPAPVRKRLEVMAILAIIVVSSVSIGIIIAPYLGRIANPSQYQVGQVQTSSSQVFTTSAITTSSSPFYSTSSSLLHWSSTSTSPEKQKWTGSNANVISYTQAASYVGQVRTVEGTIVYTYVSGGTVFLDFHFPYQGYFYAVIFASDTSSFKFSPNSFYLNKEVRITGTIQLYQGSPEIIVRSPSQIEVAYMGFSYP
jgi:hypothetical protein